ncbi:hypothetical protein ACTMTJ_21365 [Phytohabitans sp. LJ34]|uniref:hypothetical protein n=1 Tax=Phytohabitans sp. LJ34 TaxID=3452217 RepID=UPI003F8AA208
MSEDHDRAEPFTDDELAFLRHVRFGSLPARVRPEDLVETEEADRSREEPQEPMVPREWG